MGKSKKKKQKVADFQKVKLKVGKTKPVGANVTNTSFTTSTIHIGSQFEGSNELVNRKKLSLKDLLNQLNHYNVNVRHEALDGLRDLFQTHPVVMHSQLSVWLSKVFSKILDLDAAVRHSFNLCVDHAFAELIEDEVSPFFKVIMTHICCGLTHINENVQLDSLNTLGIVIDRYPSSFVLFSNKVLDHVIDLISKQGSKENSCQQMKSNKSPKGISSLVSRQLIGNADSRLTTFKVRTRVLEQLYKIIEVFRQPTKEDKVKHDVDNNNVIYVTEKSPVFIGLYKYGVNPAPVENIQLGAWLEIDEHNKMISDMGDTQSLIRKIFPIILSIWVEYEPNKLAANLNDSQTSRSIVPGVKIIIDLLDILLDPHQKCDRSFHGNVHFLFKSFSKELISHFFPSFILPVHSKSTSNKTIGTGNPDVVQKCSIDFNFLMAKIICSLLRPSHYGTSLITEPKQRISFIKDLISFISLTIDLNNLVIDDNKIVQLLIIFDDLVQVISITKDKKEVEMFNSDVMFGNILKVYKMASLSSPWRLPLFNFFSKYIIKDKYKGLVDDAVLSKYLKDFTQSVINDVSSWPSSSEALITKSLQFIKMILVCNFVDCYTAQNISNSLIEITNPNGLFKNLKEELQKCVIEILYHIDIPNAVLGNLAKICHLDSISTNVKKYVISVVGYCNHQKEKTLELERYLSFMLSVIVGFSMDDMQKFNVECPNSVSWSILNIFPNKLIVIPLDYAIAQLSQLNGVGSALSILVPVIGRFLIQLRKLPVTVAHGLLKLLEHFSSKQEFQSVPDTFHPLGSEINQIVDLLSAVLLYSCSSTYKSVSRADLNHCNFNELQFLEDDLIYLSTNLLLANRMLLHLLIKKWINVLGEYKMNAVCVHSIIEVLIALLKDPKLLSMLTELKLNLQSIVNAFYSIRSPQIQQSLVEQLRIQVMLL